MKKTPFGAFLTPALTGRPPAEIRIDRSLLRVARTFKRTYAQCTSVSLRFSGQVVQPPSVSYRKKFPSRSICAFLSDTSPDRTKSFRLYPWPRDRCILE